MRAPFYKVYISDTDRDVTEFVESFEYEDCIKEASLVTIKIFDTFVLDRVEDSDFISGKILAFQFGFIGEDAAVSPVHKAKITDVDVDYSERVTMTIKATDLGVRMGKDSSAKVWTGKTGSEIAEELAEKHGLEAIVDKTTKKWEIPQGHKDDFAFLQYLAKREADGNHICYVRNDTLYYVRRNLDKAATYSFTYSQDEKTVRFKSTMEETTGSTGGVKSKTATSDLLNKTHKGSEADNKSVKNMIDTGDYKTVYDADGNIVGKKVKDGTPIAKKPTVTDAVVGKVSELGKTIITPATDAMEASNLVNSDHKEGKFSFLKCTLNCPGEPGMAPDTLITMAGVAKRDLGNWYLEKVKHTIEAGGYMIEATGRKNATKVKTDAKSSNKNTTIGKKKTGEDPKVISVYDANGNHIGDKTASGKYTAA